MENIKISYCTICQYPEEALLNAYRIKPYIDEIITGSIIRSVS